MEFDVVRGADTEHVLVVCTGNLCRSPMAEALLRRRLEERGRHEVVVTSAGTRAAWSGATAEAARVVTEMGGHLDGHRTTRSDRGTVLAADLVIAMTADHVIDLVYEVPECADRVFKLAELARRTAEVGPRRDDEPLPAYVARLADGRPDKPWVASNADPDVPDPMGETVEYYREIAVEIDRMLDPVVEAVWPAPPPAAP